MRHRLYCVMCFDQVGPVHVIHNYPRQWRHCFVLFFPPFIFLFHLHSPLTLSVNRHRELLLPVWHCMNHPYFECAVDSTLLKNVCLFCSVNKQTNKKRKFLSYVGIWRAKREKKTLPRIFRNHLQKNIFIRNWRGFLMLKRKFAHLKSSFSDFFFFFTFSDCCLYYLPPYG